MDQLFNLFIGLNPLHSPLRSACIRILIMGVVLVVVSGCEGDAASSSHSVKLASPDSIDAQPSVVDVQNVEYRQLPGGARILTGDVVNQTDAAVTIVQIEFSLFDADNRKVDTLMMVVRDIEPRGVQSFREPIVSDADVRAARARRAFIP